MPDQPAGGSSHAGMDCPYSRRRPTMRRPLLLILGALGSSSGLAVDESVVSPAPATTLPSLVISAEKRPALVLETPLSVTALSRDEVAAANSNQLAGLSHYVPNLNMIEFTARAISNPKARGVGGSPTNPAVTTVLDGVPLLNGDLTNLELFDVQQIEVVRGPIGALYGRNTPGGVINILSRMPELSSTANFHSQGADDAQRQLGLRAATSLANQQLGVSLAGGQNRRDGYSFNGHSGQDLDFRDARYARLQMAWVPDWRWAARLLIARERARDGDFGLYDLASLRARPRYVEHDFTGFTHRDVDFNALHLSYHGNRYTLRSVTGYVPYRAHEQTDLDLSAADRLTRDNQRNGRQFTQELIASNLEDRPWNLGPVQIHGLMGLFGFQQHTRQDAINRIRPAFILEFAGLFLPDGAGLDDLPGELRSNLGGARYRNRVALDDEGFGVFGQTRFVWSAWELSLGIRWDRERKRGDLSREFFYVNADDVRLYEFDISRVNAKRRFRDWSPRVSLSWELRPALRAYTSWARGYRAGGFNVTPAEGQESFDEDFSSQWELGLKGLWWDRRLAVNLAWFRIKLDDLQFNLPAPRSFYGNLGDFYIDNVGSARNQGLDLELRAELPWRLRLQLAAGVLDARFGAGSQSQGDDISGNRVPLSPQRSLTVGLHWSYPVAGWTLTLKPEYQRLGDYHYDESNRARQPPYELFHLSAGVRKAGVSISFWGSNLRNRSAVPLAIPFDGIAPSDYAGESSAPRVLGASLRWEWR